MIKVAKDICRFDENSPQPYRRLSVRECARIQTFPDNFVYHYQNLTSAYKMIGNAVPVNFSIALAQTIFRDLFAIKEEIINLQDEEREKVDSKSPTKQLELDLVTN